MMNNRGAVLPITLAFVLAFTMLGFSTVYLSTMQNEAANESITSEKAFWLAEAGIQKALWEVDHNSCKGLVAKSTKIACDQGCAKCGVKTFASAVNDMKGYYDLELSSASSSVTSTGSYPEREKKPNRAQRTVRLSGNSPFDHAIFARQKIQFTNLTQVDSYNSNIGYEASKSTNGNIGSNDITSEAIDFMNYNGAIDVIKGKVSTGPGGNVLSYPLTPVQIDAILDVTHDNKREFEPVVKPSTWQVRNQLELVNGGEETLSANNYQYPSIRMVNGSKLTINGDVKIYLTNSGGKALELVNSSEIIINENSSLTIYTDGDIKLPNTSKINNKTRDPKNFTINGSATNTNNQEIDIWNNGDFYGAIYAPDAEISITNDGDIYGAVVGRSFKLWNSVNLHYDESLAKDISSTDTTWKEINDHLVP